LPLRKPALDVVPQVVLAHGRREQIGSGVPLDQLGRGALQAPDRDGAAPGWAIDSRHDNLALGGVVDDSVRGALLDVPHEVASDKFFGTACAQCWVGRANKLKHVGEARRSGRYCR